MESVEKLNTDSDNSTQKDCNIEILSQSKPDNHSRMMEDVVCSKDIDSFTCPLLNSNISKYGFSKDDVSNLNLLADPILKKPECDENIEIEPSDAPMDQYKIDEYLALSRDQDDFGIQMKNTNKDFLKLNYHSNPTSKENIFSSFNTNHIDQFQRDKIDDTTFLPSSYSEPVENITDFSTLNQTNPIPENNIYQWSEDTNPHKNHPFNGNLASLNNSDIIEFINLQHEFDSLQKISSNEEDIEDPYIGFNDILYISHVPFDNTKHNENQKDLAFFSQEDGIPDPFKHSNISNKEIEDDYLQIFNSPYNSNANPETNILSRTNGSNIAKKDDMDDITMEKTISNESNDKSGIFPSYKNKSNTQSDSISPKDQIRKKLKPVRSRLSGKKSEEDKSEEKETIPVFYDEEEKRKQAMFRTEEEDLLNPDGQLHEKTIDDYFKLLQEYASSNKKKKVMGLTIPVVEMIKVNFVVEDNPGSIDFHETISEIDNKRPDMLLIPVHIANHYQLFIIDDHNIEFYDSLGCDNSAIYPIVRFLRTTNFYGDKEKDFTIEKKNTPNQTNYSDCGVFVCLNARYRIEKEEFTYPNDRIPAFRKHIYQELKSGAISSTLPCEYSTKSEKSDVNGNNDVKTTK